MSHSKVVNNCARWLNRNGGPWTQFTSRCALVRYVYLAWMMHHCGRWMYPAPVRVNVSMWDSLCTLLVWWLPCWGGCTQIMWVYSSVVTAPCSLLGCIIQYTQCNRRTLQRWVNVLYPLVDGKFKAANVSCWGGYNISVPSDGWNIYFISVQ